MKIRFSGLDRYETPLFILCNPGCYYRDGVLTNVAGILNNTSEEEFVFNFNAVSELSFRITDARKEDEDGNDIFEKVANKRLIFIDDIGFFVIREVELGDDGITRYKDVRAESAEAELMERKLPFMDNGTDYVQDEATTATYRFATDGDDTGIMEKLLSVNPNWTLRYVDPEIASRVRTFEDFPSDTNVLSFMMNEVQTAYECIILFDTINRKIDVYSQENYIDETDIHITNDDLIKSSEMTEDSGNICTALTVFGSDELTINAVNPLGTNVLYDFGYYLDWMSEELAEKVICWQGLINTYAEEDYYGAAISYYELMTEISGQDGEIERLNTRLRTYNMLKENIVATSGDIDVSEYVSVINNAGGTVTLDSDESIENILSAINGYIEEDTDALEEVLQSRNENAELAEESGEIISEISEELAMENYFTESELAELSNYIFEGQFDYEYIVVTESMTWTQRLAQMKELYEIGRKHLKKVSSPAYTYDADAESFVFIKEFEPWTEQLETGCIIHVESPDGEITPLFLTGIELNYEDRNMRLTFGDRLDRTDMKSLFEDVLGNVRKTSNDVAYVRNVVKPMKNGEFNAFKSALEMSRDLTLDDAIHSDHEDVTIDGDGYTGRHYNVETGEFDPEQIKITGENIVFTDDAWESAKAALGKVTLPNGEMKYGINAEVLLGDTIIGNEVQIINEDGDNVFEVMEGSIQTYLSGELGDLEDEVSETYSTISQTNSKISTNINNSYTEEKNDELIQTFEDSYLGVGVGSIDARVRQTIENYTDEELDESWSTLSNIEITASGISAEVTSIVNGFDADMTAEQNSLTSGSDPLVLKSAVANMVADGFSGMEDYIDGKVGTIEDAYSATYWGNNNTGITYRVTTTANNYTDAQFAEYEDSLSELSVKINSISATITPGMLNGKLDEEGEADSATVTEHVREACEFSSSDNTVVIDEAEERFEDGWVLEAGDDAAESESDYKVSGTTEDPIVTFMKDCEVSEGVIQNQPQNYGHGWEIVYDTDAEVTSDTSSVIVTERCEYIISNDELVIKDENTYLANGWSKVREEGTVTDRAGEAVVCETSGSNHYIKDASEKFADGWVLIAGNTIIDSIEGIVVTKESSTYKINIKKEPRYGSGIFELPDSAKNITIYDVNEMYADGWRFNKGSVTSSDTAIQALGDSTGSVYREGGYDSEKDSDGWGPSTGGSITPSEGVIRVYCIRIPAVYTESFGDILPPSDRVYWYKNISDISQCRWIKDYTADKYHWEKESVCYWEKNYNGDQCYWGKDILQDFSKQSERTETVEKTIGEYCEFEYNPNTGAYDIVNRSEMIASGWTLVESSSYRDEYTKEECTYVNNTEIQYADERHNDGWDLIIDSEEIPIDRYHNDMAISVSVNNIVTVSETPYFAEDSIQYKYENGKYKFNYSTYTIDKVDEDKYSADGWTVEIIESQQAVFEMSTYYIDDNGIRHERTSSEMTEKGWTLGAGTYYVTEDCDIELLDDTQEYDPSTNTYILTDINDRYYEILLYGSMLFSYPGRDGNWEWYKDGIVKTIDESKVEQVVVRSPFFTDTSYFEDAEDVLNNTSLGVQSGNYSGAEQRVSDGWELKLRSVDYDSETSQIISYTYYWEIVLYRQKASNESVAGNPLCCWVEPETGDVWYKSFQYDTYRWKKGEVVKAYPQTEKLQNNWTYVPGDASSVTVLTKPVGYIVNDDYSLSIVDYNSNIADGWVIIDDGLPETYVEEVEPEFENIGFEDITGVRVKNEEQMTSNGFELIVEEYQFEDLVTACSTLDSAYWADSPRYIESHYGSVVFDIDNNKIYDDHEMSVYYGYSEKYHLWCPDKSNDPNYAPIEWSTYGYGFLQKYDNIFEYIESTGEIIYDMNGDDGYYDHYQDRLNDGWTFDYEYEREYQGQTYYVYFWNKIIYIPYETKSMTVDGQVTDVRVATGAPACVWIREKPRWANESYPPGRIYWARTVEVQKRHWEKSIAEHPDAKWVKVLSKSRLYWQKTYQLPASRWEKEVTTTQTYFSIFGWDLKSTGFVISSKYNPVFICDYTGVTINGDGTFTGTILSTAGKIGSWSINSDSLYMNHGWGIDDSICLMPTKGISVSDEFKLNASGSITSEGRNRLMELSTKGIKFSGNEDSMTCELTDARISLYKNKTYKFIYDAFISPTDSGKTKSVSNICLSIGADYHDITGYANDGDEYYSGIVVCGYSNNTVLTANKNASMYSGARTFYNGEWKWIYERVNVDGINALLVGGNTCHIGQTIYCVHNIPIPDDMWKFAVNGRPGANIPPYLPYNFRQWELGILYPLYPYVMSVPTDVIKITSIKAMQGRQYDFYDSYPLGDYGFGFPRTYGGVVVTDTNPDPFVTDLVLGFHPVIMVLSGKYAAGFYYGYDYGSIQIYGNGFGENHVVSGGYGLVINGNVSQSSSARYKTNIEDADDLPMFDNENARPVYYELENNVVKKYTEVGFIAEEIEKFYPDLVTCDDSGLPDSVDYDKITVLLVADIKRLREEVSRLEEILNNKEHHSGEEV